MEVARLQVFLPLSPTHCLVLYDSRIYRMGSRRSHYCTSVTSAAEINQLNSLQVLQAAQNVYFTKIADGAAVRSLMLQHANDRPKRRMTFVETDEVSRPDGTSSSLIHQFQPLLRCRLKLSDLRFKAGVTDVPLHDRLHSRRDHERGSNEQQGGTTYRASKIFSAHDDIK
jgi:hypothetical protein